MRVSDNGSRPELVIFDLDGTLYPRERYVDLVLDVISRGLVELSRATADAARSRVALLRSMMEEDWDGTSTTAFMVAEGVDATEWRDFRTEHLDIASGLTPDDLVVGQIVHLRRHAPVALLTNNTRALTDQILQKIGFPGDAFDAIISAEDVGASPKPSPAAFQAVIGRLGVPARDTWSIGDRYDIDVAPLAALGGAGVTVSGPAEIGGAIAFLIDRSAGVLDRQP
ncbi:MAG TPA: HAD family hydrolase [Streptosporangiaceae bacterium]|nr:HAD family hydrolase [Streptosporangiaceae bacterium]